MIKKTQKNIIKYEITLRVYLKKINSETVYNDKHITTEINIYNDRVCPSFRYNKIPKNNEYCTYLSATLLDSILVNPDKEYYPQILLEECKYVMKNRKIINTVSEDLELTESDDESDK